jgi:hypothetical protein
VSLLVEKTAHYLPFPSAIGSSMLDVTYDIRARSRDDYWISIAEQSNRFASETIGTNKYLVDAIPLRGQHTLLTISRSSF